MSPRPILLCFACLTLLPGQIVRGQAPAAPGQATPPERTVCTDLYGDPLPEGAVARMGTVRLRHQQRIEAVAFSPDGKLLASCGWDEAIRLWDSTTGKLVRELINQRRESTLGIAFSPDGKKLASAGEAGTVRLWDVGTGKALSTNNGPRERLRGIVFSPDGRTFASAGNDASLTLWNTADGAELRQLQVAQRRHYDSHAVAFSPDGKALASGLGQAIQVWNLKTNDQPLVIPKAHGVEVTSVSFLDNQTLISGGHHYVNITKEVGRPAVRSIGEVRFWDAATGKRLRELQREDTDEGMCSIAVSRDGKVLAVAYRDKIQFWNLPEGKPLRQIRDYRNSFGQHAGDLAFSPDGKRLAARSGDHVVRLWDVTTGKRFLAFSQSHAGRVASVAYSPGGRLLATGSDDGTVRLWDQGTAREILSREFGTGYLSGASAVAFSPDGKALAAGGYDYLPKKYESVGLLELWDGTPGKKAWARTVNLRISAKAFSPDGKTVAAAGWDLERLGGPAEPGGNPIFLRDRATGKEVGRLAGHKQGKTHALRFSSDGKTLTSVGDDRALRTWELATNKERSHFILPAGRPSLNSAAFSPDGTLLVTSDLFTDTLLLWDPVTGDEVNRIQVPRSKGSILAVSPDGRLLASGSIGLTLVDQEYDYDLHLWDLITGREVCQFHPGSPTVISLAFAPDGRSLTSGMDNGTALIWDLTRRPGRPMKGLRENDLNRLWSDLGEPDPSTAYPAVWALAATPEKAIALIRDRLRLAAAPDRKRIRELIAALDRSEFVAREAAFKELEKLAEDVQPMLRQALQEKPTLEQRRRLELLLAGTRTVRFPEALRQVRAVQVLEYIGTPGVEEVLKRLADGAPEVRLTREAKASLQRLTQRPTGKP